MSDELPTQDDYVACVEAVVREFELGLRRGSHVTIEEVLSLHADLPRRMLLPALIEAELDVFGSGREATESYQSRFSDYQDMIAEIVAAPVGAEHLPLALGERVGRYVVRRLLGKGAIGYVYLAADESTGQTVAIKILRRDWQDIDERFIELFRKEAHYAGKLDHPSIVRYLQSGTQDNLPYHIFQYIDGDNLLEFRQKHQISSMDAIRFVAQMADAIEHAHRLGLVHRDLKPTNILLDQEGGIHVTDFGVAIDDHEQGTGARFAGSILYMSPEQVSDQSHYVDARSDVYALGVILYELLTGTHPTCVNERLPTDQLVEAVKNKQPRPFKASIPKELRRICLEALAKNPLHRFNSAGELAIALRRYLYKRKFASASSKVAIGLGTLSCLLIAIVLIAPTARNWLQRGSQAADHSSSRHDQEWREPPELEPKDITESLSLEELLAKGISNMTTSDAEDAAEKVISRLIQNESDADAMWSYFAPGEDNTLQTCLIHNCATLGLESERMVERIRIEKNADLRCAMILALGEYSTEQFSVSAREDLLPMVLQMYCTDPSASIHAACAWLMHKWGYQGELEQVHRKFFVGEPWGDFEWFNDLPDLTMVAFKDLRIGLRSDVKPFAISSYELTNWQSDWIIQMPHLPRNERLAHGARHIMSWHQGAEWCNRLSAIYGLANTELCYADLGSINYQAIVGSELKHAFRMPSVNEWIWAARANTNTQRYWGRDDNFTGKFAHHKALPLRGPTVVGIRKANAFGLFDVLGNVSEWMHSVEFSTESGNLHVQRPVRGGSAWTRPELMQVDEAFTLPASDVGQRLGLRIARTLNMVTPSKQEPSLELRRKLPIVIQRPSGQTPLTISAESRHTTPRRLGMYVCKIHRGENSINELAIVNPLPISVQVLDVSLEGGWSVAGQSAFPIQLEAGSSASLPVSLEQSVPGLQVCNATLWWSTESGHEGKVDWDLTTFVSGPVVSVFGESIPDLARIEVNFGSVVPGTEVKQLLSLTNIGSEKLCLMSPIAEGALEIAHASESASLFNGQRTSYEFRIRANRAGLHAGSMTIPTDDPLLPKIQVIAKVEAKSLAQTAVLGLFRRGQWYLDYSRDGVADEVIAFGREGDQPHVGDFDGDGLPDFAISRPLDSKTLVQFRLAANGQIVSREYPVSKGQIAVADWNSDRCSDIAFALPAVDSNALSWNVDWDGDAAWDQTFNYGLKDDIVMVGDWVGAGKLEVGVVRNPVTRQGILSWLLGSVYDGNGSEMGFGVPGDLPVSADFNGDGKYDLGVYRMVDNEGVFFFNFEPDHDSEAFVRFGEAGDIPFVFMAPPQKDQNDGTRN